MLHANSIDVYRLNRNKFYEASIDVNQSGMISVRCPMHCHLHNKLMWWWSFQWWRWWWSWWWLVSSGNFSHRPLISKCAWRFSYWDRFQLIIINDYNRSVDLVMIQVDSGRRVEQVWKKERDGSELVIEVVRLMKRYTNNMKTKRKEPSYKKPKMDTSI